MLLRGFVYVALRQSPFPRCLAHPIKLGALMALPAMGDVVPAVTCVLIAARSAAPVLSCCLHSFSPRR